MSFTYIDIEKMRDLDAKDFLDRTPFPHVNPEGFLTDEGFRILMDNLPSMDLFSASFGVERNYGQASHDRYELFHHDSLPLPEAWKDFIRELRSDEYSDFLKRFFDITEPFTIRFQWHYAVFGCSVSPHVDSRRKIGSHLFYLNTHDDWKEEWGGATIVLANTAKHIPRESAPELGAFDVQITSKTLDNRSFIFKNTDNAWHAVAEMRPEEGHVRRMFAVVIEKVPRPMSLTDRILARIKRISRALHQRIRL